MTISRRRSLSSAVLQIIGGVLIFFGSAASRADDAPTWTFWVGLAVGIYFLATGGFRFREALKLSRD